MFIADPVIKMAITPVNREGTDKLGKALTRFTREDPTFRMFTDEETNEMVIAGMGELHLEIYVERISANTKLKSKSVLQRVSYREAPTVSAEYNYKHKKQTGGSGQFAHIVGKMEVLPEESEEEIFWVRQRHHPR